MDHLRPAVVAVGYNRPDALARLLNSISRAAFDAGDVTLVISVDHADNQADVLAVADEFIWTHGEKRVRAMERKQGLRSHILQCGDLLVAPGFYRYVCAALDFYGDAPEIAGISLYNHAWNGYADVQFLPQRNEFDTYLGQFSVTWGQCWTASQWRRFRDWYERHPELPADFSARVPADIARWPETSWGKYFVGHLVENDLYYVMPYASLSTNCEEAGQHAEGGSDAHQVMLLEGADKQYAFAPLSKAVRYDLFFERLGLDLSAYGVDGRNVCVDLHGTKPGLMGKRYLLTCKTYDLPCKACFGMRMRPIEANVTYGILGNDIRLYDAQNGLPAPSSNNVFRRMQYEQYRFGWRRLLRYALTDMGRRIRGRLRRIFAK